MKRIPLILALLAVVVLAGWVIAQEVKGPDAAGEKPQADAAAQENTPAPETVLASIGEKEITFGDLEDFLAKSQIPPEQRGMLRHQALKNLVANELTRAFIEQLDMEVTEEDLAMVRVDITRQAQQKGMEYEAFVEAQGIDEKDLENQAKIRKAFEQTETEAKAKEFVKSHPRIFSGIGVNGRILFTDLNYYDETALQKETRDEMAQAVKQVVEGKTQLQDVVEAHQGWRDMQIDSQALQEMHPGLALAVADVKAGQATDPIQLSQGLAVFLVDDVLESKAILADKARAMLAKLNTQASEEEVQKLVDEHPEYFDGTQVQASHILLKVDPETPAQKREERKEKLEQIAKDIADEKISFQEAAMAHSDCPSKQRGGDLGLFSFERMVTPFSKAAFATQVGQVTDIVETQFGYHIIKVTKVVGPEASAQDAAKDFLSWQIQKDMFAQAFRTPIRITEAGEALKPGPGKMPMMPPTPAPQSDGQGK